MHEVIQAAIAGQQVYSCAHIQRVHPVLHEQDKSGIVESWEHCLMQHGMCRVSCKVVQRQKTQHIISLGTSKG